MEFTLPKVSEEIVTISPEATQAILDIMTDKKMENHVLRIYVAGSSCSGVQFGMALDDNINTTDTQVDVDGLKIVIDHQSLEYANGATIEFVNDPQHGTGFVISNPNAQSGGCGCGGHDDAEASSCGGGDGSCGCGH